MDVARVLETDQLISIGHYQRLSPADRPTGLRCAGTLRTGQTCQGTVFPRALTSRVLAPHFASREHGPGCDEAAIEHGTTDDISDQTRDPQAAAPTQVIVLTPAPSAPNAHAATHLGPEPPAGQTRTHHRLVGNAASLGGERQTTLREALRTLVGRGFRDGALIRWTETVIPATRFFIPLDSVDHDQPAVRGYWGLVDRAEVFRRTGAVHLYPRTGALIVIRRDIADELGLHDAAELAALRQRYVLAISAVRTSAAGRPYVLVTDAAAIVSWAPPRSQLSS